MNVPLNQIIRKHNRQFAIVCAYDNSDNVVLIMMIMMMMMMVMMTGDVAETRRDSSADDRSVSVRSGHSHQRRLQSTMGRMASDDPGREAVRRGILLLPDQHQTRPRYVRHPTQRPKYVSVIDDTQRIFPRDSVACYSARLTRMQMRGGSRKSVWMD